ncbi:hypothetical protein BGW41_005632 [Actinomortierella wolfii]|nr:hypothetical protein BGW41_005632 [Actinomortierella wolfii]
MTVALGECIGTGGYSSVHRATWRGLPCAVKKFHATETGQLNLKVQNEISILKKLKNRYIIQLFDVVHENDQILVIMDIAENGSLADVIMKGDLGWSTKERLAHEIARGLEYIHAEGILHRDLKSQNVLLNGHMEVKLCDFGFAMDSASKTTVPSPSIQGTLRWMAPELLSRQPIYSTKSDMYAYGMVLWEMAACCTRPFKLQPDESTVAVLIEEGEREEIPYDTPVQYNEWIIRCWDQLPSNRPEAKEVTFFSLATDDNTVDESDSDETLWMKSLTLVNSFSVAKSFRTLCEYDTSNHEDLATHETESVKWLSTAAENGNPIAQFNLAVLHFRGQRVEQSDTEAVKWFQKAAAQGNPQAQFNLGCMHAEGRSVVQSDAEAFKWYLKAAEQGYASAQFNVAVSYDNGHGVEQNDAEAVKWYLKAAENGVPNAKRNLELMYNAGRCTTVRPDKVTIQGLPQEEYSPGVMRYDGREVPRVAGVQSANAQYVLSPLQPDNQEVKKAGLVHPAAMR